ncbi:precorrin-3B synthase [Gordonia defluvii]|uniref:Precorrin-3B synthase n=1 Tax=Gordonia defluvii TaxID=283718 RepID=A0ABP6LIJ3_9ACTN|nr:precorrin-3B synthase [Gordonia sp. UBA5067]
MPPVQPRTGADRCPGVLSTHEARDGALARIRLPGGRIRPDQLAVAARVAQDHGDGHLELTSRGNVQLRGLHDPDAAADALLAIGLGSPGAADTIRNIIGSPLAGRIGGHGSIDETITTLDEALRGAPITGLSGRFLFGVDDGRGDVLAQHPDVAVQWRPDGHVTLIVADTTVGVLPRVEAVGALLAAARAFASAASGSWRIRELDDTGREALIATLVGGLPAMTDQVTPGQPVTADDESPLVGWFGQDDAQVLLGAVTPAGRLPARTAEFLAAVQAPIIITPRREILLADLTEPVAETALRVLAPIGLIFDAESPWARLSCCTGQPGCAKSHTDVRIDTAGHAARDRADLPPNGLREHWVGCSRGCGSPTAPHLRVEAQPDGTYRRTRID